MGRSVADTEAHGSGDVAPYAQEKGLMCLHVLGNLVAVAQQLLTSLQGIYAGSQMPA